MPEYEVIWNGAHGDQDRDLLQPWMRVPEKRAAAPLPTRHPHGTIDKVIIALLRHGPITLRQLGEVTGLASGTIDSDLYKLRRTGRLRARQAGTEGAKRRQVYWLVETTS